MSDPLEIHVEQLIGRVVRDPSGAVVGRIEELATRLVDGRLTVMEFHIGPAAVLERLGGVALSLPFLSSLPIPRWEYRVDSLLMDLSTADQPRLLCSKEQLARVRSEN